MSWSLTPLAESQLEGIYSYTIEEWGEAQALVYLQALYARFDHIAGYPHAGKIRDDVGLGYRSIPSERHIIFYRIVDEDVQILGVPHGSTDPENYLS